MRRSILRLVFRHPWLSLLVSCALLIAFGEFMDYNACNSTWARSGMRAEYGVMTGCQIEVQPGKWVPAKQYRELP